MRVVDDLMNYGRRLHQWWSIDIWSIAHTPEQLSAVDRIGNNIARTLYIVANGFRTERIKLRAAHLTYVTMISIVPALVVMFSVFTAFRGLSGVQHSLKTFVVDSIAFSHQETLDRYLDSFLRQAGTIGGFGIGVLVFTMVTMIGNIERAFNDIWGVRRDRTLLQRFQVYWPLVTLGPILLGLSISVTAAAATSSVLRQMAILTPFVDLGIKVLPLFLTCASLTLLYMLLPNTRVPLRAAAIGGLVAGTLWEMAKYLYAFYAEMMLSRPSIYGSLAAVPLFILWLYVSWVLALLGASLTFAVQNARTYEPENEKSKRPSQRDREFLAIRFLMMVSDNFDRGAGAVIGQKLISEVIVSPRFAESVLSELVDCGLLIDRIGSSEEQAYLPGKPLHSMTVPGIIRAMRRGSAEDGDELSIPNDDPLGQRVNRALIDAERTMDEALGRISLAELLSEARSDEEDRSPPKVAPYEAALRR